MRLNATMAFLGISAMVFAGCQRTGVKDGALYAVCEIEVKEGCLEKHLAEIEKVVPKVRAEKGCVAYTPLVDVATGLAGQAPLRTNVITVVECWESEAAMKAHLAQPHMEAYRTAVRDLRQKTSLYVSRAVK